MLQVAKRELGGSKRPEAQRSLFSDFHSRLELLLQQVSLQMHTRQSPTAEKSSGI